MDNKHMKRCSTSCVILQIKTMRCHIFNRYLLEWSKSKALTKPHAVEEVQQQEISFNDDGRQNRTATWKDSLVVSYKTQLSFTI